MFFPLHQAASTTLSRDEGSTLLSDPGFSSWPGFGPSTHFLPLRLSFLSCEMGTDMALSTGIIKRPLQEETDVAQEGSGLIFRPSSLYFQTQWPLFITKIL